MKTLRTFLSSILVVGLSGFSIPSFADDTELYVQNTTPVINSSTRPNLLLIVDNSGSLLEEDIVTGKDANGRDIKSSRLNVLTDALLRVLDEAQNVNIGLERFTFHHGAGGNTPIIYPVSYIDEPVATSNISLDYKVQDGLDDAEEGLTNEPVIVGDKVIEMTRRVGTDILFGDKVVTTQVAIAENADDSRESLGNSKFYPPVGAETSVYSPVPAAGTNYPTAGPISSIANSIALGASVSQQQEEIVGLRFKNLNVPKNATILAASLEFTANATVLSNGCNCDGTPLNLQIKVEDADSANAFSASGNGTISTS